MKRPSRWRAATVRARVTITQPLNPTPFFVECVTAPDGKCQLRFTTPAPGVTQVRMDFETVEGYAGGVTATGFPRTINSP